MVRKIGCSKKLSSKSMFDVEFEVVLIVVLIVVAILLIVYLNRKFNSETFLVGKIKDEMKNENEHLHIDRHVHVINHVHEHTDDHGHTHENINTQENFTEHSNTNNNNNNNSGKTLNFFFANWCGYSRKYIENELPKLEMMLKDVGLASSFKKIDVETPEGRKEANIANVTGLPSMYYKHSNGKYEKINNNKDLNKLVNGLKA